MQVTVLHVRSAGCEGGGRKEEMRGTGMLLALAAVLLSCASARHLEVIFMK